jgi:hypothetical protein
MDVKNKFILKRLSFNVVKISTKKKCLRLERHFWFNLVYDYKAELTVLIILAAILYGSPLDAGLLSSNHPFHPF